MGRVYKHQLWRIVGSSTHDTTAFVGLLQQPMPPGVAVCLVTQVIEKAKHPRGQQNKRYTQARVSN